jgi:septal ring-binding cell division protein DamX
MSDRSRTLPTVLPRSQLRRLALQFYIGEIDEVDYGRRRRTLLDGISDGDIAIAREAPPTPAPMSTEPPPVTPAPRRGVPFSPLHVLVGLVFVAVAAWVLRPPSDTPDDTPRASAGTTARPTTIPTRTISEARTLVETFLAVRNWSAPAIGQFEMSWAALPAEQRDDARTSGWYRNLVKATRDELKTQKALAEFDKNGTAPAMAIRLAAFHAYLGGAPETFAATAPAGAGVVARAQEPESRTAAPPARLPAPPPARSSSDPAPATPSPRPTGEGPADGRTWLAAQDDEAYTLQLFALNHLDRIERLMARHPDLEMHVVADEAGAPRYRVLLGSFPSEPKAWAAHARLPYDIQALQARPLVKTFAELRPASEPGASEPGPSEAPAATARVVHDDWLELASGDHYTLQLFASERRDRIELLLAANPALDLQVVQTHAGRTLYRVLLGTYASPEAAAQASAALPEELVRETGRPLVKTIAELRASR